MITDLFLANMNPLEHIASKDLFHIGPFAFTNHMFMISISSLVLCILMPLAVGRKKLQRKGLATMIEATCMYIRQEVARPFLKDKTDKYIGFIWTIFFFILTMNLLGLFPLDRLIWAFTSWEHNHLAGTATGNVWVTGALAGFSFCLFHYAGIRENGFINYVKHFAPKVPLLLLPFIFFMEVVSSFIKVFSLAIRLFANMLKRIHIC